VSDRLEPAALERAARESLLALDRRGFLRLAGLAAAAGLVPAGCGSPPPPGVTLRALTPRTYAIFRAAALRLVGPAPAALVASGAIDPGLLADAWLTRVPELAPPLRQGLLVLELAPWPLLPKLRPFTALGGAAQDAVLDHLMRAGADWKRQLFQGVKSFACLTTYATAPARALTGYPGPFGGAGVTIADALRYDDAD
jgi:hypothetical protein